MGIRTHPLLRLTSDPKRGNHTATGAALNSEGDRNKEVWGKRAKWVDYWANIDGHQVGIAFFDHPSNPRHPTWWHARDYGLVAANPFGAKAFDKTVVRSGDFTIPNGESATFRYRFVFHKGDAESAKIDQLYSAFANNK